MPDGPILDPQVIESLRALNPGDNGAFLRELASLFLDDVPLRLSELTGSLASGDRATFTRAAHSIKGSSANMGAVALRDAAERLEDQARRAGLVEVQPLIAAIGAEFDRTKVALRALTE